MSLLKPGCKHGSHRRRPLTDHCHPSAHKKEYREKYGIQDEQNKDYDSNCQQKLSVHGFAFGMIF
jgi:hypothetical protein